MVRGFTPIIGLAVVVALALAAVFGSMSLAPNPAQAQSVRDISLNAVGGVTTVTLSWMVPDGITVADTDWDVRQSETMGGVEGASWTDSSATADGTSRSLLITGLTNNVTYYFQIQGTAASTRVALSDIVMATPRAAPTNAPTSIAGTGGAGTIALTWAYAQGTVPATGFQVAASTTSIAADDWMTIEGSTGGTRSYTITGLEAGTYSANVRALNDGSTADAAAGTAATSITVAAAPSVPEVTLASSDPGDNTRIEVEFSPGEELRTGVHQITIEFTDFTVPSSIDADDITISVEGAYGTTDATERMLQATGEDVVVTNRAAGVSVDGEKVIIDLKVLSDDFVDKIDSTVEVTVVISQAAGISNPTEAKSYDEVEVNGVVAKAIPIDLKLSLSEDEGGRNDTITVTGKGFKNGTTMTAYKLMSMDSGFDGAQSLCSATVDGDDVGKCEFTVTSPLFTSGANYINVKDGRNQSVDSPKEFTLEPSISVSPAGASVGDSVQVQMYDFMRGSSVQGVRIARQYLCMQSGMPISLMMECGDGYTNWTPGVSTSDLGEQSFNVTIPDDAPQGRQELRVETATENDSTNIVITGPVITSTPSTVLANQRISLTGTGFTAGSEIDVITFAGEQILPANINGGEDVNVDNGGNWSSSVVLPMTNSTTSAGDHAIKVRDSQGRGGQVMVTVPERRVTITPDTGRVGSIAVVRGENFPSKNDDGEAFSITIEYAASNGRTTSTTVPDASGRFEQQITVPTTANIPSTNSVTVSFTTSAGTKVPLLVNHNVPEGAISLSATSGSPGAVITVSGEGFKGFVPVSSVKVGPIEVTPSPRPSTDVQGMVEFDITIPGLDTGIQTVEVMIGGTTASVGFTVTASGIAAGAIVPVGEGLESLGDNLESIWHFNNDNKMWAFYDGQEGSDLTILTSGETYLINVKSTVEVILNGKTRNLTCANGNCWNQIVW